MTALKYSLTGCGAVAKVHLYHIAQEADCEIVAVHDTDSKKAEEIAELFNIPRTYTEYSEMLETEKPDAVSISTPPHVHFEQTMECIKRGINVLCEKPLAMSYDEGRRVVDASRERNTILSVMLPRRFYSNTAAVKEVLLKRGIGDINRVKFTLSCNKQEDYYRGWRAKKNMAGGGVLMSQAIHCIDRLIYLFGAPQKVTGRIWRTREYLEVEDVANARLEYENGMEILIQASNSTNIEWMGIIEILGSKGRIVLDSERTRVWDVTGFDPPFDEKSDNQFSEEFKPAYYGPGHGKVIHDFLRAVGKNEVLQMDIDKALLSLKTVLKIYESAEQGCHSINMEDRLSVC